jgi:lipoprotein-anchoring transpeptidase ErfK/SrfK
MRRLATTAACLLLAGLIVNLMAAAAAVAQSGQTQVRYNFSGSSFASPPDRTVSSAMWSAPARGAPVSRYAGKRIVEFTRPLAPGSILINTAERRLYFVLEGGKAIQYGVGVGREGFAWRGRERISRKAEWPGWTPPPRMIARERAKGIILPAYMPGGPNNPLGARALYLGGSLFRIHGTNQPHTIGQAVSSGCIRMLNDEVIDLYNRAKIGTLVIVE